MSVFGDYPYLEDNPFLNTSMKKMISPHLLPLEHAAMPRLNQIFSQAGVVHDERSLIGAGFSIIDIRKKSAVIVALHSLLPGFVFKIYRDTAPTGRKDVAGWESLTRRCENAKKIKALIQEQGIICFTVPDKWLYILPITSDPPGENHQPVILLATDMEIVSRKETEIAWKRRITPRYLDELYIILKAGYGSTCLIGNMPFTKAGSFAILDLEYPKRKFNMKEVEQYLSKDMKQYWHSIAY